MMDQSKLLEIFLTESDDLIVDLEQGLVALEDRPTDAEAINRIFRAAHTFKGNAGMVNLDKIVEFAHVMEHALDKVRSHELSITKELISTLLGAVDVLKEMIGTVAQGLGLESTPEARRLIDRLKDFVNPPKAKESLSPGRPSTRPSMIPLGPRVYEIQLVLREDIFETGQDPSLLIQELEEVAEILSVEANSSRIGKLDALDMYKCYISWKIVVRSESGRAPIDGVFIFVKDENPIVIKDVTQTYHQGVDISAAEKKVGELLVEEGFIKGPEIREILSQQKRIGELLVQSGKVETEAINKVLAKQQAARKVVRNTSIRVDTDKLDRLVNLVGELVISVSQVTTKSRDASATADARVAAVESLELICRDLQEQVMAVRMVPVEETFNRFTRAVRDLASELGKYVILETAGAETELDKNVIEQLGDPLKHMIRNCVAHGLESPQERIAAGKSDTGRILLKASQREGQVFIEVSDDGRGIDPERVLEKARQKGLVAEGKSLTEKQIFSLIFEPGFSTAQQVNEISGRGVGLDVVKRNVEELRGTVEVESVFGKGSTFRIRLPLTLAIIDGMNVRVGDEIMTIPLMSVIELIEPRKDNVKTIESKGEIVDVRGEILPMIRLCEVFNLPVGSGKDTKIVVVENDGRKFGVLVDKVLGMSQSVVKPLDKSFGLFIRLDANYERPRGIAGATILSDGSVGLIIDINGVEQMAFGANYGRSFHRGTA